MALANRERESHELVVRVFTAEFGARSHHPLVRTKALS